MLNIHQKSTGVFRLNIGSGYDHDHDMWDAQKEDWVKVKSEIEKKSSHFYYAQRLVYDFGRELSL